MTIAPDAPTRSIDGVELTKKEVEWSFPPVFDNVEDERRHRKEKLAGALRIFGRLGFAEGVAGHITVRDPEFPDLFWVNPLGLSFRHMTVSDLILVDHNGDIVYGRRPVNRAAFVIHSAIHEARPDVIAAAHSHSVHGKAWSSLGRPLDPITQDACYFYEDHVVTLAPPRSLEVGDRDVAPDVMPLSLGLEDHVVGPALGLKVRYVGLGRVDDHARIPR
ncbi:MAG: class II aldolase/adducin family protein [Proteobacteria bacterium]|nr:class II aldolase/adducin family protein [Pseudomonadota bacterium]